MTRVLLLGGMGFIGRNLAPALAKAGSKVVTLSRSHEADVQLDATDLEALDEYLRLHEYDTVVNLLGAGLGSGSASNTKLTDVNAVLPARLLAVLSDLPTQPHLIHTASSTERSGAGAQDESAYSRSKTEGTKALREASLTTGGPLTVLVLHNTYGADQPADRFVAMTTARLQSGSPVILEYPDRVRDFVHIDDVVQTYVQATKVRPAGTVEFEVGTGVGLTLLDAATEIARAVDAPTTLVGRITPARVDMNPVTVCPVRFGDLGRCTTDFHDGIRRTVKGTSCAGS